MGNYYINENFISARLSKSTDYIELAKTTYDVTRVSAQIWWESINAFDGIIKAYIKKHANAPYVEVPLLKFTIDNYDGMGGGSIIFTHNEYCGVSFAITIDKGSATTGSFSTLTETFNRSVGSSYSMKSDDRIIIYPSTTSYSGGALSNSVIGKTMTLGAITSGVSYLITHNLDKRWVKVYFWDNVSQTPTFLGIQRQYPTDTRNIFEVVTTSDIPAGQIVAYIQAWDD